MREVFDSNNGEIISQTEHAIPNDILQDEEITEYIAVSWKFEDTEHHEENVSGFSIVEIGSTSLDDLKKSINELLDEKFMRLKKEVKG